MNPIEQYFFDNNIDVWSIRNTGVVTYFNTSNGEYLADQNMNLFQIYNNHKIFIDLKKPVIAGREFED